MAVLGLTEREDIKNGTAEKRFQNARRELESDFSESSANDFFYTYCDWPLSQILCHSRDIFSEPYCGYDFYKKIFSGNIYDTRSYGHEAEKVSAYLELAKKKNVPEHQIEKYEKLFELLVELTNSYQNVSRVLSIGANCEGGYTFIETIADTMYELESEPDKKPEIEHPIDVMDHMIEVLLESKSLYCKIPLLLLISIRHPQYIPYLREEIKRNTVEVLSDSSVTDVSNVERIRYILSVMMKDSILVEELQKPKCEDLLTEILGFLKEPDYIEKRIMPKLDVDDSSDESMKYMDSVTSSINAYVESVDNDPQVQISRYDYLKKLLSVYEAKLEPISDYMESASSVERLQYENVSDMIDELEAQLLFYEWESDGSPNAVIQQHIMTSKEMTKFREEKEDKRATLLKSLKEKNQDSLDEVANEAGLLEEIEADMKIISGLSSSSDKETAKTKIREIRSRINRYRKEAEKKNYRSAIRVIEDLEAAMGEVDPIYESIENKSDKLFAMYMEKADDGETKRKVKKPHTDIATKIQNKALDRAAKDEERLSKATEKVQKLKNAGNAVSQTPKKIGNDISNFVKTFDKWDDNRRKKFLLKPGFRHKIFKKFRQALTLGAVANFKLAWIPMAALLHHCSKLKDGRIRNELAMELDNEIKICEEKIQDANADGDKQKKYELMRIKDKLEAEKTRVRINSKMV